MCVRANVNQNIKAQACGNYDYFEGKEVEERRQREAKRMDDMFHREDDDRFLRHVNFIFQYFRRTHNSRQFCILKIQEANLDDSFSFWSFGKQKLTTVSVCGAPGSKS